MSFGMSRAKSLLQWLRKVAGENSLVIYFLLFILLFSSSVNIDYQTGLDAYTIGDYQTAMKKWTAVVEGPASAVDPLDYVEAHYAIAMLYWEGQGVPRDFRKSHEWLLKAANLNHAGAQTKLGYLYTDGVAVPRDLNMAFEWYSEAAKQGDKEGQYNLGIFYLNGWGTEQDNTMAKMYLSAASAQGYDVAEQALVKANSFAINDYEPAIPDKAPVPEETPVLDEAPVLDLAAISDVSAISDAAHVPDAGPVRDEAWILSQDPSHYTIQVIGLSTIEKIEALVSGHDNLAPFAIYVVQRSSRPIHVLIQGSYPDVDAARSARDNFPREINPPDQVWIRQFGKIQKLIAAENTGEA
jgi:hypothetical protein